MLFLHLLPTAKDVFDREQTHIGEIVRVLCRNLLVDWAVEAAMISCASGV